MLPGRRDSDPRIHIASADDEPMTPIEERRTGLPDRRSGDPSSETRPSGTDWKLWIQLGGFLILLITTLFSAARNQAASELAVREVSEVRNQLKSIEAQLTASAIDRKGMEQEVSFLKKAFEDYKRENDARNTMSDTYMTNTRERLLKLEAEAKGR